MSITIRNENDFKELLESWPGGFEYTTQRYPDNTPVVILNFIVGIIGISLENYEKISDAIWANIVELRQIYGNKGKLYIRRLPSFESDNFGPDEYDTKPGLRVDYRIGIHFTGEYEYLQEGFNSGCYLPLYLQEGESGVLLN